jgi:hypothetical protein
MFGGKFAHFDDEVVFKIFNKVNSIYQNELESLFFEDMQRVKETFSSLRFITRDYRKEVEKLDKYSEVSKQLPKTEFIVDKYNKQRELDLIYRLLLAQIDLNIKERESKGENMNIIKLELKKYFSGIKTKECVRTFNQLFAQANAKLDLLKLPDSFRQYEKKIKETILENLEKLFGQDPQKKINEAINKIQRQMAGIETFVVKDGSEMEMAAETKENKNTKNLIELQDSFTKDKKHRVLDKYSSKKSIYRNKIKNSPKEEEEKELILTQDTHDIDLAEIEAAENEVQKQKLEFLLDFKTSLNEDDSSSLVYENEKSIDLALLKNKSLSELSKMDIEEVASYDVDMDHNGNYSVRTVSENNSEMSVLEKNITVASQKGKINKVDLLNAPEESSFISVYNKIKHSMNKKDIERANKIELALERGQYLDDPIYVELLMTHPRYMKLREHFLKKYFTKDALQTKEPNILQRYMDTGVEMIQKMEKDGLYYLYDSEEGKQVFKLYDKFMHDLEKGEEDDVADIECLGGDWKMENDHEDKAVDNMQEYLNDRMKELTDEKSIYFNFDDAPIKKSKQNQHTEAPLNYIKGRSLKDGQKKIKLH